MSFQLEIIASNRKIYEGIVDRLIVPSKSGQLTILSHHIPLVTLLDIGEVKIVNPKKEVQYLSISQGIMEVKKEKVILLVEDGRFDSEITEKEVKEAEVKAKEILAKKPAMEMRLTATQALRRSLVDQKVAKRRRQQPL